MKRLLSCLSCLFFLIALTWQAETKTSANICLKYISYASKKTGVKPEILRAVARTESNFGTGPWPWAVNYAGKSHYFPSQKAAEKFLKKVAKNKRARVDVGCMQLSWRYHGGSFGQIHKMINPKSNMLYGAQLLKTLYKEKKSWPAAIGAYHSRNPKYSKPYIVRVSKYMVRLVPDEVTKKKNVSHKNKHHKKLKKHHPHALLPSHHHHLKKMIKKHHKKYKKKVLLHPHHKKKILKQHHKAHVTKHHKKHLKKHLALKRKKHHIARKDDDYDGLTYT
jgi:hypothetical protein